MKTPRLARSKSRSNDPSLAATGKSKESGGRTKSVSPYKASFDDLRSPDGRQKLREQLSSAFPESHAESLTSSPIAASMRGKEWLNAASSSSSLDSAANGPKRLSTLPEQMHAIDVEQAIHLLTELKKTATPEQLVALHKALLPTRDSVISTADSAASHGKRTSVIRQKSMFPPGLATRGSATDDPLKRQEDLEPAAKKRDGRFEAHRRVQSDDRLAALDLAADESANSCPAKRAVTPNDQHYFGGFQPGTLRITNGAASPEPSLRPKTSIEGIVLGVSDEQVMIGLARAESLAQAVSEAQSRRESINDDPEKSAPIIQSESQPLPFHPKTREAALSWSREPSQTRSLGPSPAASRDVSRTRRRQSRPSMDLQDSSMYSVTPTARSREPSSTRAPMHVDAKQIKPALAGSRKSSADTLLRRSVESFTIRRSIDDGRVSPLDAPPRFAQRWSHRASQISQEYTSECVVPLSPFGEDRQNAMTFAQRLSTVFDGEDAEDTTTETPETALSKLEGNASSPQEQSDEQSALRATAEQLKDVVRPPMMKHYSAPRPMPTKADSGYVSDASHQSLQRGASYDADTRRSVTSITHEPEQSGAGAAASSYVPTADEERRQLAASMPSLPHQPTTPSRPYASRKHSSLLKLPALMKSNLGASRSTLEARDSVESSPQQAETPGSSAADPKTVKPSKRLQKRMPEEIRKQRKALREKEKQKQLTLALSEQYGNAIEFNLVSSPLPFSEPATPMSPTASASPAAAQSPSLPVELAGDYPQPTEPETDESATAPKPQNKQARRRSRTSTIIAAAIGTDTEDADEQKQRKRSFSLGRKRSKSKRQSGSLTPRRKSQNVPAVPSIAALSATWDDNDSNEDLALYLDHSSVSRTLGTNPYDISTAMFEHGNSSRNVSELQSPHQISTTLARSSNGGLRGMDSAMASELARRKSRDVAIQNNENVYERPRMATPRTRSQTDVPRARDTMPNAMTVEQRSPSWDSKPVFHKASFESLHGPPRQRPHSMADSIPSLPELPADAEARSAKATEYLARYREGMQTYPVLAESPSPKPSPNPINTEHPGFSSESVAEAVAKAVEARRAKRAEMVKQGQKADRLRPLGPRMNSDTSSSSSRISLQLRTSPERPNSDVSTSVMVGAGSDRDSGEAQPHTATAQEESDEPSVWERQAELWRQKRESVGQSLSAPIDHAAHANDEQMRTASPVVISPHGTSSGRDSLPSARRRGESASEHANAYRDLIGDDRASFNPTPDPHRASTQSMSTITGRSTPDVIAIETALPAKAYQAPIIRARSPGGRVRTPSGSYHPYTPVHAAQAERSRAASLVQLESKSSRGTQSLDIQRRPPHHEPSDTLESIVGRYDRTLSPVPASEAGSIESSGKKSEASASLIDRYGGGLQYGYERGVGLKGSSGMRSSMVAKMPRSGNQFSEHFGLDLGDVPMFLSRAT